MMQYSMRSDAATSPPTTRAHHRTRGAEPWPTASKGKWPRAAPIWRMTTAMERLCNDDCTI